MDILVTHSLEPCMSASKHAAVFSDTHPSAVMVILSLHLIGSCRLVTCIIVSRYGVYNPNTAPIQVSTHCFAKLPVLPAATSIWPLYLAFQKQVSKQVRSWQGGNCRQEASQQV